MKRKRYQAGFVERQTRKRGPDVWSFRYRDAEGAERKRILGDVKELPTKTLAERRADVFRASLSEQREVTYFGTLIERYKLEALPQRHATASGYLSSLRRIEERWAKVRIDDIRVLDIEQWLASLQTQPQSPRVKPQPLAKHTLSNMKAMMHRVWQCGIRWGVLQLGNRVALVEIKHIRRPRAKVRMVLTKGEFLALAEDPGLSLMVRLMISISVMLGLRVSELLGLRWEDFNEDYSTVLIQRAVVRNRIEATKTAESEAPLPVPARVVELLAAWREAQPDVKGWLFGSPLTNRPLSPVNILRRYIRPAAERYGITGLGWHSFRHTLRSIARDVEIESEDQRQLMRHTNIRMTEHYGQDNVQRLRRLRAAAERISNAIDAAEKTPQIAAPGNTIAQVGVSDAADR